MTAGTGEHVRTLLAHLQDRASTSVLAEAGREIPSDELLRRAVGWEGELASRGVGSGTVCSFIGDYAGDTVALLLALMRLGAVAMPLSPGAVPAMGELLAIAGARWLIDFRSVGDGGPSIEPVSATSPNPLVEAFRSTGHPGLVVFTSGSSGRPKGILHDFDRVLAKFAVSRPGWRAILFLMMDHFGGINTLCSCLKHGGVGICVGQRTPEAVCQSIESHRADLLPTTPTFLNMLLASGAWRKYDLSSLRLITYGAEPMPVATLQRIAAVFPNAKLQQTYGLSELGVLRSQSADRESLWLRVGGAGFETRVVDNVLHIRSISNMVGYLNAPSPIDAEGWMNTGDVVEERDGMLRFMGRVSEVINVGGQKVFPAEVEGVLLEAPGVAEATVYGRAHPLLGQAVCARVSLLAPEAHEAVVERLRGHCRERLSKFKVPIRIDVVEHDTQLSDRAKKVRTVAPC
ncbi:MAG TPA: long-chain fatty acid--CoA ligase [Candidatus Sulfotelmatobacter sp.]|nr:long-chain fatty acid--CoA ligase [Candidatus Sulfotelmatobacter sp.]